MISIPMPYYNCIKLSFSIKNRLFLFLDLAEEFDKNIPKSFSIASESIQIEYNITYNEI